MIEEMLTDLHTADPEWNVVLVRYFNPIGAHESGRIGEDPEGIPNNLVPYVAQVAVGKLDRQMQVFGDDYDTPDGPGVRDYIHVVDLARGHVAALDWMNGREGVEVFNLGTGHGTSVLEVVAAFSAACRELPLARSARAAGATSPPSTETPPMPSARWDGRPSSTSRTCAEIPGTGSPRTRTASRPPSNPSDTIQKSGASVSSPFSEFLSRHAGEINDALVSYFTGKTGNGDIEAYLYAPLRRFTANAGKRHRPLDLHAACASVGGESRAPRAPRRRSSTSRPRRSSMTTSPTTARCVAASPACT